MVKNTLEKLFSKTLKANYSIWGMKLHNNPLTHQTTPADYIVNTKSEKKYDVCEKYTCNLIECKQVTCQNGKGRLAFKRLKQMHDLLSFQQVYPTFHRSYFCIAFYDNGWNNSDIYLIPVKEMEHFVTNHSMKSANREMMRIYFKDQLVQIKHGEGIDLWTKLK